jgi:hypothetical protein
VKKPKPFIIPKIRYAGQILLRQQDGPYWVGVDGPRQRNAKQLRSPLSSVPAGTASTSLQIVSTPTHATNKQTPILASSISKPSSPISMIMPGETIKWPSDNTSSVTNSARFSHHTNPIQYNPHLGTRRGGICLQEQPAAQDRINALDKTLKLKRGLIRPHVHWCDLWIKVKQSKSDEDEVITLQKAVQVFFDIMIQADPSSIILPYFECDCNDKSVPDPSSKLNTTTLDSIPLLKWYFSRYQIKMTKGMYTAVLSLLKISHSSILWKKQDHL